MAASRVVLHVLTESGCPIFSTGDRMVVELPGVDAQASSAVCALALASFVRDSRGDCPAVQGPEGEVLCPRAERPVRFGIERVPPGPVSSPIRAVLTEDLPMAVAALRAVPVFRAVSAAALEGVAASLVTETYAPGAVIVERAQPGRALFVVERGEVEVVGQSEDGHEATVQVLGEHDCFGETSILSGAPTMARVVARGEVQVLVLAADAFGRLLQAQPDLSHRFARLLATRLVAANHLRAREASSAFRGKLEVMSLAAVLQVLAEARRSGRLHLGHPDGERGWVGLSEGRALDASLGDATGAEAVYGLLRWTRGDFWLELEPVPREDHIRMAVMGLLLEGMRRMDEEDA